MIELKQLAEKIQEKLNSIDQDLWEFSVVSDTAKFKRATRDKNDIKEYINCLLTSNTSDVSTLSNDYLFSTLTCTLRIIMRMKGFEEDVYSTGENPELISMGDKTRVMLMRQYLDGIFQSNEVYELNDNPSAPEKGLDFVVSAVYEFAQSGVRAQVEKLGDSYTFSTTIYYSFVQSGINTKSVTFMLDGAMIPYQSVTCYRTPTMDGNVYANTRSGSTKNLAGQSTFSIAFELPALKDTTTMNMLDYLLNGDMNQAHLIRVKIGAKEKDYLVSYSELKVIGEIIKNLGQHITFVEVPDIYDVLSFGNGLYIYEATGDIESLTIPEGAQVHIFRESSDPEDTTIYKYDHIVSTKPLNNANLGDVT